MLACQEPVPPITDDDWLYELKYDGYRSLAAVQGGSAQLFTRSLNDCSSSYPEVVRALARITGGPHVLDGELCCLKAGVSDFNAFHQLRAGRGLPPKLPLVTFVVFDLLLFDGLDVTEWPLEQRKTLLQLLLLDAGLEPLGWGESVRDQLRLIDGPPPGVLMAADFRASAAVFAALVGAGLPIEGVMAKRREGVYRPNERTSEWLKIKRPGWQEGRAWRNF